VKLVNSKWTPSCAPKIQNGRLSMLQLQILNRNHVKNHGTYSIFESSMNFKGVQTFWEKSDKFYKILPWLDLHKSEFSWAHMYVRIRIRKQVPKGLSLNKKKRVWIWNSNLTILIIQIKLVRISFKLPKFIVSYYFNTVASTVTPRASHSCPSPGAPDNPHYLVIRRVGPGPSGTIQEGTQGLDPPAHHGW
jgi:hypothetical protein